MPTPDDIRSWLADPHLDIERMRIISRDRRFHAALAQHPAAPPGLLAWLSGSPDPAVRSALAERRAHQAAAEEPTVSQGFFGGFSGDHALDLAPGRAHPEGSRPRRYLVWLVVGAVVVTLVAALAMASLLGGSRAPGPTPSAEDKESAQPHPPTADPNFRNGAELAWSLSLRELFPHAPDPSVSVGHRHGYLAGERYAAEAWPTLDGVTVLAVDLGNDSGRRHVAVELDGGAELWIADDVVMCRAAGALYCLRGDGQVVEVDIRTGAQEALFHAPAAAPDMRRVLVADPAGVAVIDQNERSTLIRGAARASGQVWDYRLGGQPAATEPMPSWNATRDGVLSIDAPPEGSADPYRHWIDLSNGDLLAAGATQGAVLASDRKLVHEAGYGFMPGTSPQVPLQPQPDGVRVALVEGPSSGEGLLALTDRGGLQVCPKGALDSCRDVEGPLEGVELSNAHVSVNDGTTYLTISHDYGAHTVIDGDSASFLGTFTEDVGWQLEPDQELPTLRTRLDTSLGNDEVLRFLDPITKAMVGAVPSDGWVGLPTSVDGYLPLAKVNPDDEPGRAQEIGMYRAATKPVGFALPGDEIPEPPKRPDGLPECHDNTVELAWAAWPEGWMQVCGYYPDLPTRLSMSVDGVELTSSEIVYDGLGMYKAALGEGEAWMVHAPATVGMSDTSGEVVFQRSVGKLFYAALQRFEPKTGAFGAVLPEDTAEDQVRYLSEIIERSKKARSALAPAVTAVSECASQDGSYAGQIAVIDSVTVNREELLRAAAAAPVNHIPDGPQLVTELATALRYSHDADVAYGRWAREVHAHGCGSGSPADGNAASEKAGEAKTVFAQRWNEQIAAAFAVPTVARHEL